MGGIYCVVGILALLLVQHAQNGFCSGQFLRSTTANVIDSSTRGAGKGYTGAPTSLSRARRLLDATSSSLPAAADAVANITVVTTAREFQAAVTSGAQDIQIREHLDLSDLAPALHTDFIFATVLGTTKPSTRSIQGFCNDPPPDASAWGLPGPEIQWKAPQCVILCDHFVFTVESPLWVDSLYLRRRPSTFYRFEFFVLQGDAELYGTGLTLQGNGADNSTAAATFSSGPKAFFANSTFDSMGGEVQLFTFVESSLVLQNCTVSNMQQRTAQRDFVEATGRNANQGVVAVGQPSASATVLNTTFENVQAVNLFWEEEAAVIASGLEFSNVTSAAARWDADGNVTITSGDDAGAVVRGHLGDLRRPVASMEDERPEAFGPGASRVRSLGPNDVWFRSVQQSIGSAGPEQFNIAGDPPPIPPPLPPLGVSGDAAPSVAAVYSAVEFQRAFHEGVQDIEIRSHLDLRGLPPAPDPIVPYNDTFRYQIGHVGNSTRSIRGRCETPGTGPLAPGTFDRGIPDAEPWQAPRCVLLTSQDFVSVNSSRLWLDSLHIQIRGNAEEVQTSGSTPCAVKTGDFGHVYMTNTVVQGDTRSDGTGAQALTGIGGIFAQDCVFSSLEGESAGRAVFAIESCCTLVSCTFRSLPPPVVTPIHTNSPFRNGPLMSTGLNATLALQNSTFVDGFEPGQIVTGLGGLLYSDRQQQTVREFGDQQTFAPQPLSALANRSSRFVPPLQASDPWFVAAREALASPPGSTYLPDYPIRVPQEQTQSAPQLQTSPAASGLQGTGTAPSQPSEAATTPAPSGSSGQSTTGRIVGITLAALAVILLPGAALLFAGARRRRRNEAAHNAGTGGTTVPDPGQTEAQKVDMHAAGPAFPHQGPWPGALQVTAPPRGGLVQSITSSQNTFSSISQLSWHHFTSEQAETELGKLTCALDAMAAMRERFYNRFLLHSAAERRVGGQGVVQFANTADLGDQVAIKNFLDKAAFDSEKGLYTETRLKAIMPATLAVEENASGECRTPYGYVFPPFVIIERGQSLDEFARDNADGDFVTTFQALTHAVRALAKLHSFGYAHRDIKPGNILRRPKQHDWTLIDVGCAAAIGTTARLMYSLQYAAPEVIHALEAGERTIIVDAAVDMWALGVIAFELLTGEKALARIPMAPAEESERAIMDAISGRTRLPWEGRGGDARARLGKLRVLRSTVLQCLEREASRRPTADALLQAWDNMFDNMQARTGSTVYSRATATATPARPKYP